MRRSADGVRPQATAHGHRAANGAAAAALLSLQLLTVTPVALAEVRLPPIDTGATPQQKAGRTRVTSLAPLTLAPSSLPDAPPPAWCADPNRCERGFTGNTIGQANAVSDKLLDLRGCSFDNKSLAGRTLSGALMVGTSFKGSDLTEVIMSKAYAVNANFDGATFKNAVLDRVIFNNSSFKNVLFTNSVITGAEFEGADRSGAKFEDTLVGQEDLKRICGNATLEDEQRMQLGCR